MTAFEDTIALRVIYMRSYALKYKMFVENATSVSLVERKTLRLAVGWVILILKGVWKPELSTD